MSAVVSAMQAFLPHILPLMLHTSHLIAKDCGVCMQPRSNTCRNLWNAIQVAVWITKKSLDRDVQILPALTFHHTWPITVWSSYACWIVSLLLSYKIVQPHGSVRLKEEEFRFKIPQVLQLKHADDAFSVLTSQVVSSGNFLSLTAISYMIHPQTHFVYYAEKIPVFLCTGG